MQTKKCYKNIEKDTRTVISLRMALFAASSPAMRRWKKYNVSKKKKWPGLIFLMIKQQQEKAFFLMRVACGEWKGVRNT